MVGPPPPSPPPHGRASSARGSYTLIIPPVCRCGCQWTGRAGRIIASLNDCYSDICCYRLLIWSHYIYQRGARALRGVGGPHRRFTNSCSFKRERNKKTDPPTPHPTPGHRVTPPNVFVLTRRLFILQRAVGRSADMSQLLSVKNQDVFCSRSARQKLHQHREQEADGRNLNRILKIRENCTLCSR